jgi:hypothetical protein
MLLVRNSYLLFAQISPCGGERVSCLVSLEWETVRIARGSCGKEKKRKNGKKE